MTEKRDSFHRPKGWVRVRLGEISAKITDGTHFTPKYVENGVPFISAKDIYERKISFDDCKYISAEEHNSLIRRCNPEYLDVLITKSGTIGRTAVVRTNRPFSLFVSVALIKPFKAYIDSDFIAFSLRNYINNISIEQSVKGGVIKNLHIEDLKEIVLPLCPLPEQCRIVAKVEELFTNLDAGVESLKKVKMQLKRYRQAVLKYAFEGKLTEEWRKTHKDEIEPASVLLERIKEERRKNAEGKYEEMPSIDTYHLPKLPETWVWTTISEFETFIGSGITPRGGKKVYVDEGIPFIRSQNVHPDGLRLKDIAYVTPQMHEEMKRTKTHPSDVLLNITGASIGRSTYIPERLTEANVNQHVCIIRTGWWLVSPYLSSFLNSAYGQDQIFSTESGVTRQGLNYGQVRSLKIPLAPLLEQKIVAAKIEEAFSIAYETEKSVERTLKQTNQMRQSILKRAFEGRLVSQDSSDEPAEKLLERIKQERVKRESATKGKREIILGKMGLMRYVQ
ncbi:MAG TPA: restriction endonuclease subunit S [Candidatus Bathyarchaeia archaeon]|nr:restriction endonuclease subunit S [Candidatus Bathyarchaeia archaeon]